MISRSSMCGAALRAKTNLMTMLDWGQISQPPFFCLEPLSVSKNKSNSTKVYELGQDL